MIKKEDLERLYIKEGMSQVNVGKILGCSDWKVRKYMRIYGIKTRTDREQALKYSFNEHYFDVVDTENKAYILGLLYADGYLSKSRKHSTGRVGISLNTKDAKIIEEINREWESNYPIHHYTTTSGYKIGSEYSRLIVTSPHFYEQVKNKGCLEEKTENLYFPTEEQVPRELLPSFLHGYFDGDGSVRNNGTWRISIMGTIPFLESIIELFGLQGKKLYNRNPGSKSINRSLDFNVSETYSFGEYINQHSGIRLERKDVKIKEMLESQGRL